jgi:hypothetical protein
MTREEKCKLAIERGFIYDSETGYIYNRYGRISKSINSNGYIKMCLTCEEKKYQLAAHHFAWFCINNNCEFEQLDHINGVRNDNRISNLRNVNNQKNQWNQKKAKGYSYHKKSKKWMACIRLNYKLIHLGSFNTEQEARNAYINAKEKYHII